MKNIFYYFLLSSIFTISSYAETPRSIQHAQAETVPELIVPALAPAPVPPAVAVPVLPAPGTAVEEIGMGIGMLISFGVVLPFGFYTGFLAL